MKIKKLLQIVLVAPSYLIVSDSGTNRTVYCNTNGYIKGEMYELEEESAESKFKPIKKDKFKFEDDEEQEAEV